jgi:hypothetical protein
MLQNARSFVIITDIKRKTPFIYDAAYGFSKGFAVVMRYGEYGYVYRYGNDTFSII